LKKTCLYKCFNLIAALLLSLLTASYIEAATPANGAAERIAGADRYETAAQIAEKGWPTGTSSVVLARGDLFPDALAGAPLAFNLDAPILLTSKKQLPAATKTEIKKLNAKKAYILGGPKAIENSVEKELKAMGLATERIYGNDRYDTAIEIAKELGAEKNEAIIATGVDFPDALSIASYAAEKKIPILLAKPDELPAKVASYVANMKKTYVIGGTKAISHRVEKLLPNPTRLAGNSRYDTSIEILNYFYDTNEKLYVSTGENFADALAGSVLAAKNSTGVLLVDKKQPVGDIEFLISGNQVKTFSLFGGQAAISNHVVGELAKISNSYNDSIGAAKVTGKLIKATAKQAKAFEQSTKMMKSNGTLSVNIDKSIASSFKSGQLILFPPTDKHPYGFIGKILSVNNSSGEILLGQPALEDVFAKLTINKGKDISLLDIQHFSLNNGVSLKLNNQLIRSVDEWRNLINHSDHENLKNAPLSLNVSSIAIEKILQDGTKKQISLDGVFELKNIVTKVETEYHSSRGLSKLNLDFTAEQITDIQVNYNWDGEIGRPLSNFDHDWATSIASDKGNRYLLGVITYKLGTIHLFGLNSASPIEMPIGLSVSLISDHKGKVIANAEFTITNYSKQQANVQWNGQNKSFSSITNPETKRSNIEMKGNISGNVTNEIGVLPALQIGGLLPANLHIYDSINTSMKVNGEFSVDLTTAETTKATGCLKGSLNAIKGSRINARLKTLSYDATKGNSFIKDLYYKKTFDQSFDKCTNQGVLTGVIQDAKSGAVLPNVNIIAYKDGIPQESATSSSNGIYQLNLQEGTYTVTFSKDGYQTEKMENVSIVKNSVFVSPNILLTSSADKGIGTVSGKILDALNGNVVSGATIQLRRGYQTKTGDIVASTVTDENGRYSILNLPSGLYTAEVIKDGYIPYTFNIRSVSGQTVKEQNGIVSPLLNEGETRIVLSWGEQPSDLDAHLTGPSVGEERFHLFWDTKEHYENEELMASLSGPDVRTSFGPETVTIHKQKPGIYRFFVFNYSYRLHEGSLALANSGAKVDIYNKNMLQHVFYVPTTAPGKLWTVFELNGEMITPVNSVDDGFTFSSQFIDKNRLFMKKE
jgi:putative cell wall-binding protein